jgi:REP element-mobilizing transposase RayT
MALSEWLDLQTRFPHVELDDVILMPDHMHAIIWLTEAGENESLIKLGSVIQAFKSLTTNVYGRGVRERGWPPFDRKLWQPGYFEHIIRDDRSLERHREYIVGNPVRWRERHGG